MRKCIKVEMDWFLKSKLFFKIFIAMIAIAVFALWTNYSYIKAMYDSYNRTYANYVKYGEDVEKALNSDYKIEGASIYESGNAVIENPLAYENAMLSQLRYVVSDAYVIDQYLEYGIMFFTIIFGILGAIFATYDVKDKTLKFKTVRYNKMTLLGAKLVTMIIGIAVLVTVMALLNPLISRITGRIMLKDIDITGFALPEFTKQSGLLVKLLFTIAIGILYAFAGYMMGVLTRSNAVGIIAIFSYSVLIPIIFKFGLKNLYFSLAKKIFDFIGSYKINDVMRLGTMQSISGLAVYLIVILAIAAIVSKKRSSFV